MGFQLSPGVQVKEIDLSTSIPAVATSLGATVGRFTWGPAFEPYLCTSEADLVSVFGQPTNDTYPAFLSSAAFLSYANSLQVVRVVDSGAMNAAPSGNVTQITGAEDFETQMDSGTLTEGWYARYPGTYGNGISVETHDGSATWSAWQYAGAFDVQPDTGNDEMAVAVIVDSEVVESYLVSPVEGTKNVDGGNIWAQEKINNASKLVWVNTPQVSNTGAVSTTFTGGIAVSAGVPAHCDDGGNDDQATCEGNGNTWVLEVAAGTVGSNEYMAGWDKFENADEINVSILIAGGLSNENEAQVAIVSKYMIEQVAEKRLDCIAVVSPPKEKVVNVGGATNAVNNVIGWRTDVAFNSASSYGTLDGNYKYVYDVYSDTYRWIGFSGDIAGLMAHTDNVRDAWWSPGGLNRGQIKGVVKLAYQPSLAHREL